MAKKTVADVIKMVEENEVRFVDFRFTDTLGKWQHITTPVSQFNEDKFTEAFMIEFSISARMSFLPCAAASRTRSSAPAGAASTTR